MLLALIPWAAAAAELPFTGAYGSVVTCALYTKGGIEAVEMAIHGGPLDLSFYDAPLLILPDRAAYFGQLACAYESIEDSGDRYFVVNAKCAGDRKPDWFFDISIDGSTAVVVTAGDAHEYGVRLCEASVSMLRPASWKSDGQLR